MGVNNLTINKRKRIDMD